MDQIVTSLKIPFVEIPEAERPDHKTVALTWLATGVLVTWLLRG